MSEATVHLCSNCQHPAPDAYCPACGQSTRDLRVSIGSLLHEFFGTLFNVDGKLMRSLMPLFFKPGRLSQVFVEGKRASFVPPIRLYLVSSVLFFLTISLTLDFIAKGSEGVTIKANGKPLTQKSKAEPNPVPAVLTNTDNEPEPDPPEPSEESRPASQGKESKPDKDAQPSGWFETMAENFGKQMNEKGDKISEMDQESMVKRIIPLIVTWTSRLLFILMPLFALILKLLYIRRDPYYIDHLIFAIHYHSFLYIFLAILILMDYMLASINMEWFNTLAILFVPATYLFLAMKRMYGQGFLKTTLKFFALQGIYSLMLMFTIAASATFAVYYF